MGYSQFGEEEIVLDFFSKRPPTAVPRRVLDIGAHDGISCSNSKRLIELGWGGTLVEPSPGAFAKLMRVHANNDRVNLANVGMIYGETRVLKFYDTGGLFVGTFDDRWRDEWEGKQTVHYRPIYVVGCTFGTLFDALPGPYHFISIDVEGTNLDLFWALTRSCGDDGLRSLILGAELICVEHQGRVDEIENIATSQGFVKHAVTEANILLARA